MQRAGALEAVTSLPIPAATIFLCIRPVGAIYLSLETRDGELKGMLTGKQGGADCRIWATWGAMGRVLLVSIGVIVCQITRGQERCFRRASRIKYPKNGPMLSWLRSGGAQKTPFKLITVGDYSNDSARI